MWRAVLPSLGGCHISFLWRGHLFGDACSCSASQRRISSPASRRVPSTTCSTTTSTIPPWRTAWSRFRQRRHRHPPRRRFRAPLATMRSPLATAYLETSSPMTSQPPRSASGRPATMRAYALAPPSLAPGRSSGCASTTSDRAWRSSSSLAASIRTSPSSRAPAATSRW